MKKIYSFEINHPKNVDKTIIKQDAEGKEIKIIETTKEDNYLSYFITKPTISLNQEAEMFYESVVADCIKRGIMSQIQMRKRFLNDGGVLSEEQKTQYNNLWDKLFGLKSEYNKLNEKPDENKETLDNITKQTTDTLVQLQDFEEKNGGSIYDHTAENIARNRTALWLTLALSYQDINGKYIPVFGAGKYEDKLKKYEEIEGKEDPFDFELVQKLLLATSLWYFGKAEKQEEFEAIMDIKDRKDAIEKEKSEENKE